MKTTSDQFKASTRELRVGDKVSKLSGDYSFDGEVRAVVTKLSGLTRYVVEDDRGTLFIFNRLQLELKV